ncbi:MAG TPA: N-acyl homoserine lactonase family protein [Candidatus Limnocylindria bacterium]|nr:N-acyl homoserine lactonase family protein [Candidatus Limnocylindria bacterium]
MTLDAADVVRLDLGHFTMPAGGRIPEGERVVVTAFLIRHPRGLFLFDTGIGEGHAEAEARYRPRRRSLDAALAEVGSRTRDVRIVANCHLHFDHSGGNLRFPGVPIFAQRREHEAAFQPEYTLPDKVVDFPGARFELVDGDAEPLDGITVVPTPGHVPGHQSLVVNTRQGRIILAGQALNEASDFARAHYASRLARERQ